MTRSHALHRSDTSLVTILSAEETKRLLGRLLMQGGTLSEGAHLHHIYVRHGAVVYEFRQLTRLGGWSRK